MNQQVTNLQGNINLLNLELTGIATIKGKKCLVIPIEENDIYIGVDENSIAKSAYLSLSIFERKETGKFGDTHNVKQSFSKEFREATPKDVLEKKPYLGNMKPLIFEAKNGAATVAAPIEETEKDDLPF